MTRLEGSTYNSQVNNTSSVRVISSPGTLSGRSATLADQNNESSKGLSTIAKVLMCSAGVLVIATGTAYAMGYLSGASEGEPVITDLTVNQTKIINLSVQVVQQSIETASSNTEIISPEKINVNPLDLKNIQNLGNNRSLESSVSGDLINLVSTIGCNILVFASQLAFLGTLALTGRAFYKG